MTPPHVAPPLVRFGHYPTPVQRVEGLLARDDEVAAGSGTELWIKRDDRTSDVYGGNKVRKLEHLLADARARGAKRVVTVGAAGSHHVLATTYFGRKVGLTVEAVLVPQTASPRVVEVLRASLALGLHPIPVGSWGAAPLALARRVAAGSRLITVGGSSVVGSMGYVSAARELAAQVRRGELPEPDVCVVALGSGGTAGGLAAGFEAEGMRTRVVGVCVSTPPWVLRLSALWLARACARRAGVKASFATMRRRMTTDVRFLGGGYGHVTEAGDEATRVAREQWGITLDPTYTAKAFAGALWQVRARQAGHVLYWHTLSSAPMAPLLEGAPREEELSAPLRALLLPA
ncbi:MAG: pyridoxal-phosphate dependent enzyme [Polyangiaceae bacterium]|jgi:1-aminocyclopropane-1-carboxylate deaminase/D-cysteine desulfhydrase-like pyridoxal-dependent ACC family enzyme